MIELAETGRQLAAARAGRGDDDERLCRLDIRVGAVALGADDRLDVGRVALGEPVNIGADAHVFQLFLKDRRGGLLGVLRDDDGVDGDSQLGEVVDEAQRVLIVGDAEVGAHLVFFNRAGADAHDDLGDIRQLAQELDLAVDVKAGQDARSVVVVEQLAAEFEVELVVEAVDPLFDLLGLHFNVKRVVKAATHDISVPLM